MGRGLKFGSRVMYSGWGLRVIPCFLAAMVIASRGVSIWRCHDGELDKGNMSHQVKYRRVEYEDYDGGMGDIYYPSLPSLLMVGWSTTREVGVLPHGILRFPTAGNACLAVESTPASTPPLALWGWIAALVAWGYSTTPGLADIERETGWPGSRGPRRWVGARQTNSGPRSHWPRDSRPARRKNSKSSCDRDGLLRPLGS